MSVLLSAVCQNNMGFQPNEIFANLLVDEIRRLDFKKAINYDGTEDKSDFTYYFTEYDNSIALEINTPSDFSYTVFKNTITISTIHRYYIIHENNSTQWFKEFQSNLHKIMQLFKATELIFYSPDMELFNQTTNQIFQGDTYPNIKNDLQKKLNIPIGKNIMYNGQY